MRLILSQYCTSVTGAVEKTGYHLQRRKNGCFLKRNTITKHVPSDGHWQAVVRCAQLAKKHVWATDISIDWRELSMALYSACAFMASEHVNNNAKEKHKLIYNAEDILNLKQSFDL